MSGRSCFLILKQIVKRDQRALVLLTKSEKEQLRKQATKRNLKMSELVRQILFKDGEHQWEF